jgi:two-component system response regulator MtrA
VRRGDEALDEDLSAFALVVLDLMLPGRHGLDVLKAARRASLDVPFLILSARSDTTDKVRALELGADDYLTKPFWPEELLARVRARLRRPTLGGDPRVACGDLAIDLPARVVTVAGAVVDLTRTEFDILAALARRPGAAVSRAVLLEQAKAPHADSDAGDRALDAHISRIRKKLGSASRHLATVWAVGYRLAGDA